MEILMDVIKDYGLGRYLNEKDIRRLEYILDQLRRQKGNLSKSMVTAVVGSYLYLFKDFSRSVIEAIFRGDILWFDIKEAEEDVVKTIVKTALSKSRT